MYLLVSFVFGWALALVVARATRPIFEHQVFARTNYRGADLPTATGVLFPVVLAIAGGLIAVFSALLRSFDVSWTFVEDLRTTSLLALLMSAFALLGLLDDLVGAGESGGFRGHLRSLAHGRLTSGGLKLFGGACVGLIAAQAWGGDADLVALIRDGALVALWANVGNLFDRAPGRTTKVCMSAAWTIFLINGIANGALPDGSLVVLTGAAVALLRDDLAERSMLGDAGSNVLGALVGLAFLDAFGPLGRAIGLAIAIALNLGSEFVSYSEIIRGSRVLSAVDRLGAPHVEAAHRARRHHD